VTDDAELEQKTQAVKKRLAVGPCGPELGYSKCVLETGRHMPDAVHLYQKNGYAVIPNYGQYAAVENSICFEKSL